jgi:hypothetical protein
MFTGAGSVSKFIKNLVHSKPHSDTIDEYYRIEYQNDPLLSRKIKLPGGDWWYKNTKL